MLIFECPNADDARDLGATINGYQCLFKEGDGPGGVNTLMAFHPKSDTIFIGFTNEFGNSDEVNTMMMSVMSDVIPSQ